MAKGYLLILGAILLVLVWLWFLKFEAKLKAKGFLSLGLTLLTFIAIEHLLRVAPASDLHPEIRKTPNLYTDRLDLGNKMIEKYGFRGRRANSLDHDSVRIFCLGGSSTYGIPIVDAHYSYPFVLNKMLSQRRPREHFEVYNGGIPGYGLVQITDTIKEEVLKYKPDLITISASFNDSSPQSTWYSEDGKSDIEVYTRLRLLTLIQELPVIRTIHKSRTFAYVRYFILKVQKWILNYYAHQFPPTAPKRANYRKRLLPEEFAASLRKIAELGKEYGFVPVLIPEPISRNQPFDISTKKNPYHKAMLDVAKELDVPIIDALTPFSNRIDQWLFYDIVHPNEAGHRLMAEAIFGYLFGGEVHGRVKTALEKRGVDFLTPSVSEELELVLSYKDLEKPLRFRISAPLLESPKTVSAALYLEDVLAYRVDDIGIAPRELSFDLHKILSDSRPAYKVRVKEIMGGDNAGTGLKVELLN